MFYNQFYAKVLDQKLKQNISLSIYLTKIKNNNWLKYKSRT